MAEMTWRGLATGISGALVTLTAFGCMPGSGSGPPSGPRRLSADAEEFFRDARAVRTAAEHHDPSDDERMIAALFWGSIALGEQTGRAPALLSDPDFMSRVRALLDNYRSLTTDAPASGGLIITPDVNQSFTCATDACEVDYPAVFGGHVVAVVGTVAGFGSMILAEGSRLHTVIETVDDIISTNDVGFASAEVASYLATERGAVADAAAGIGEVLLGIIGLTASGAVAVTAAVAGAAVTAAQIYVDVELLRLTVSVCNTWQSANCCGESACAEPDRCVRCEPGREVCAPQEESDLEACTDCGLEADPCCEGSACGLGLECVAGSCVACGYADTPCCSGACDDGAGLECIDGTCQPCGRSGASCCDGACDWGSECVGSRCEPCGGDGDRCCTGAAPYACDPGADLTCIEDMCRATPLCGDRICDPAEECTEPWTGWDCILDCGSCVDGVRFVANVDWWGGTTSCTAPRCGYYGNCYIATVDISGDTILVSFVSRYDAEPDLMYTGRILPSDSWSDPRVHETELTAPNGAVLRCRWGGDSWSCSAPPWGTETCYSEIDARRCTVDDGVGCI